MEASNVRFGSKADICNAKGHVRFTPKSGPLPAWPLELKATSGTVTVRIAENGFATSRSVIKSAKGSVRAWTHNASW